MKHSLSIESATLPAEAPSSNREICGPAEKLVGVGFRCWLAGFDTGDIACWEVCWKEYLHALGPSGAKCAVTELSYWVRTLKEHSSRELKYYPFGCARFCQDERLAISLVAACQHQNCPVLNVCASALIGSQDVDPVLKATDGFASILADMDQELGADSYDVAGIDSQRGQHTAS